MKNLTAVISQYEYTCVCDTVCATVCVIVSLLCVCDCVCDSFCATVSVLCVCCVSVIVSVIVSM